MISNEKIKEAVSLRARVAAEVDKSDARLHLVFESDAVHAITLGLIIAEALDDLGINIECGGDG